VGGWPWLSLAEPVVQGGVTASGADSANGVADGLLGADQHDEFLGPGNGGVEQVALQHHLGAGGDRDDHAGVFAALGTVDADGVGVGQFVQFTELVVDVLVVVGAHGERLGRPNPELGEHFASDYRAIHQQPGARGAVGVAEVSTSRWWATAAAGNRCSASGYLLRLVATAAPGARRAVPLPEVGRVGVMHVGRSAVPSGVPGVVCPPPG
jgi:hypothetical protein